MPLLDGPHQRCCAANGFGDVRVRSRVDQGPDRIRIAITGGQHDRCFRVRTGFIRVGAGVQQTFNNHRIAVKRRHEEGTDAFASLHRHVGAPIDQQVHGFGIVAVDSPVKRGRTIPLSGIDVGPRVQERPDRGHISGLGGVREILPGLAQRERRDRQQRGHREGDECWSIHHVHDSLRLPLATVRSTCPYCRLGIPDEFRTCPGC